MVYEKDIKCKQLGPGKGALLIISGDLAEKVVKKADELKVNASDMVQSLIQAYIEDPNIREEVNRGLRG